MCEHNLQMLLNTMSQAGATGFPRENAIRDTELDGMQALHKPAYPSPSAFAAHFSVELIQLFHQ